MSLHRAPRETALRAVHPASSCLGRAAACAGATAPRSLTARAPPLRTSVRRTHAQDYSRCTSELQSALATDEPSCDDRAMVRCRLPCVVEVLSFLSLRMGFERDTIEDVLSALCVSRSDGTPATPAMRNDTPMPARAQEDRWKPVLHERWRAFFHAHSEVAPPVTSQDNVCPPKGQLHTQIRPSQLSEATCRASLVLSLLAGGSGPYLAIMPPLV